MDPRHPVIGLISNLIALVAFVGILFSLLLPILTPKGWDTVEFILLGIVILSIGVSYWARREHEVPVVHAHGDSSSQYMDLEDLPTMVSSNNEGNFVNSNTAAVIESIVGVQASQSKSSVDGAIGVLSTGEIGISSASAASEHKVQHAKVNINQENVNLPTSDVKSVPLPTFSEDKSSEEVSVAAMIDLDDLIDDDPSPKTPIDLPELPDF